METGADLFFLNAAPAARAIWDNRVLFPYRNISGARLTEENRTR